MTPQALPRRLHPLQPAAKVLATRSRFFPLLELPSCLKTSFPSVPQSQLC